MPTILCRYVLREILWPTLVAMVSLTFIILITRKVPGEGQERLLFFLLRLLFRPDAPKIDVIAILLLVLPTLLIFIMPMALLIGITIGVGRMTLDLEVRSMQTSGINLTWVFFPVVLVAAAMSLGAGIMTFAPEPLMIRASMSRAGRLLISEFSNLDAGKVYENLFGDRGGLSLYFEDREGGETQKMKGITMILDRKALASDEKKSAARQERNDAQKELKTKLAQGELTQAEYDRENSELKLRGKTEPPVMILSREAEFSADPERGTVQLNLIEGTIHLLNASPNRSELKPAEPEEAASPAEGGKGMAAETKSGGADYAILKFGKLQKSQKLLRDEASTSRHAMTIPELTTESREGDSRGSRRRALAEILERYSMAFESLILALIGIPLSVWVRPTGKSVGVVLAFALIMIYHWVLRTGSSMVESGNPLGPLIVFSPNALFAAIGSGLWWRMVRR